MDKQIHELTAANELLQEEVEYLRTQLKQVEHSDIVHHLRHQLTLAEQKNKELNDEIARLKSEQGLFLQRYLSTIETLSKQNVDVVSVMHSLQGELRHITTTTTQGEGSPQKQAAQVPTIIPPQPLLQSFSQQTDLQWDRFVAEMKSSFEQRRQRDVSVVQIQLDEANKKIKSLEGKLQQATSTSPPPTSPALFQSLAPPRSPTTQQPSPDVGILQLQQENKKLRDLNTYMNAELHKEKQRNGSLTSQTPPLTYAQECQRLREELASTVAELAQVKKSGAITTAVPPPPQPPKEWDVWVCPKCNAKNESQGHVVACMKCMNFRS
eukprot:PhF_6_TR14133/c0_g1_i1/m.22604